MELCFYHSSMGQGEWASPTKGLPGVYITVVIKVGHYFLLTDVFHSCQVLLTLGPSPRRQQPGDMGHCADMLQESKQVTFLLFHLKTLGC